MASQNAPGSVGALVCGILSLCCFPIGIAAIIMGNNAMNAAAADPSIGSADLAKVGKILGIIGIVLGVLGLVLQFVAGVALIPMESGG